MLSGLKIDNFLTQLKIKKNAGWKFASITMVIERISILAKKFRGPFGAIIAATIVEETTEVATAEAACWLCCSCCSSAIPAVEFW